MGNEQKRLLATIGWVALGISMLYVSYFEYVSWQETGIVTARREGFKMSGEGAISLLIGYVAMSLISFAFAFTTWLSKKKQK